MANSVRLRAVMRRERRRLTAKPRERKLKARVRRRYRIIAEVKRGRSAREVADRVGCHVNMVYEWIHRLNDSGFSTFERTPPLRGQPPCITSPQIRELIDIAFSSPAERGFPISAWTVPELAEYCRRRGALPPITGERVRRLLRREGWRAARIRTWKTSRPTEAFRLNTIETHLGALKRATLTHSDDLDHVVRRRRTYRYLRHRNRRAGQGRHSVTRIRSS